MLDRQFIIAIIITTLAGFSTTIGGAIGFIVRDKNHKFFSFTVGFTGGVMMGISFFELLPSGIEELGFLRACIAFFIGFIFIFLVDYFIPHEFIGQKEHMSKGTNKKLLRTGIFVALGIAIHNFPEGMAIFYGSYVDIKIGIAIAIAIALHNIPEGLAVSVPIYKATGSRGKAFMWAFISGMAEPLGAILTAFIFLPFLNIVILSYLLSAIAGIMVYISLDELMPVSHSYGFSHIPMFSFLCGMAVMFLSLYFLA
jgi:ZIP family zinc transporter